MRLILAVLAVAGSAAAMSSAAEAKDYPWCAVREEAPVYGDCYYVSFAQCKAATANEACIRNPRVTPEPPRARQTDGRSR